MADEEDLKRLHAGDVDLTMFDLRAADLSGLDLRGRDFSGANLSMANAALADFRGCKFERANLVGLKAPGANFSGVTFWGMLSGLDLQGADLTRANFQGLRISRTKFDRADISQANFNKAHFGDDVTFNDIKFDDGTDFNGAEAMRSLSRLPAFQNYHYDRGKFIRRAHGGFSASGEILVGESEALERSLQTSSGPTAISADVTVVQGRIAARSAEAKVMAANLAVAVREHITLVSASKPNEPTSLARFNEQVSFLERLADGLQDIALALEEEGRASEPEIKARSVNRAARIVADLSDNLEAWMKESGRTLIGNTVNVGLIGASSAFFSLCGAPGLYGFGTAAALIGGRPLVDAAKGFFGGSSEEKK